MSTPATAPIRTSNPMTWHTVCTPNDLTPNTGAAALIGKRQIAIVRVVDRSGAETFYGISNWCPFAKAMVIARGLVGSANGVPKIVSPIYKQGFDLRDGRCLDDANVSLPTYQVRIADGFVQVAV